MLDQCKACSNVMFRFLRATPPSVVIATTIYGVVDMALPLREFTRFI